MKNNLIFMIAALALATATTASIAGGTDTGSGKVLYNFESGTDGFWTFQHGATLKLTDDKTTGADGSTGSLEAAYQWLPGSSSYMGIGIQPKWSMAGDSWPAYAKGHMVISLKSDVPIKVSIQLRASDKKTYSFAIDDVPSTWRDYTISFDQFTNGGKPIDLTAADIDQMVIIPHKSDGSAHTLWIDNVTIFKAPAKS